MRYGQAFDVARGDVVAFIGAGGKTSLLVGLGYELAEAGWRVLATTTTTLSVEQLALFPAALPSVAPARSISAALNEHQFVLLHEQIQGGRVYGPPRDWTQTLLDRVDSDILLVEADEAGGLPFKAPRADEPQIPPETTLVISVASLSALGRPLNAEHIYNPAAMTKKYGFAENSPVKSPWLAQVLRDEELGLRGLPARARVIVYLNQTPERGYVRGRARMIARLSLQSERIAAVALGSTRGAEPVYELQRRVGALVLADGPACAGGRGPVAQIAEQLMRARIDHIGLVTGPGGAAARAALRHLGLKISYNRAHRAGGIVASLEAGLRALPAHVAALLLVPGDQTGLQTKIVYQILAAYARGQGDFLIPRYRGRNGYPILISCRYLPEILKMPRGSDLPAIISRYQPQIAYLDLDTDSILTSAKTKPAYGLLRLGARLKNMKSRRPSEP